MTESDYNGLENTKKYYFFTYYGDVYYGIMVRDESVGYYYIIPPHNIQEYRKGNNNDEDLYKRIGWEIKDLNIIVRISEEIQSDRSQIQCISITKPSKKLFVFGAGASAYCSLEKNDKDDTAVALRRLPQGNELFSEQICSSLFSEGLQSVLPIYEAKGLDLESFLQLYFEKIRSRYDEISLRNLINIQFCVQENIRSITNDIQSSFSRYNVYALFISYIRDYLQDVQNQCVSIVSFNYDTLLEKSIEMECGKTFNCMSDYVSSQNTIQLFKPHGSINWGWIATNKPSCISNQEEFLNYLYKEKNNLDTLYFEILGNAQRNIKEQSWGMEFEKQGKGRFTINKEAITVLKYNDIYYPSLLLPYSDKDDFIMPYSHQYAMRDTMRQIEELYLIGWKGNEDLFLRYLKKCRKLQKLVIVNPDAETVLKNIAGFVNYEDLELCDSFANFVIDKIKKEY
ncbi:MAG: hypothetical protein IKO90_07370 [Bacteroidales bacterium]|nr:hypothetical protein [Bacteroidales bacterium]